MDLRALAERGPNRATLPVIDRYLARMDSETKDLAEGMLRNPEFSARELSDALTESGYRVGRSSVTEWRKRNGVS